MSRLQQAVLLAAGRGSRMGPLGAHQSKAQIALAGQSLLDRNITALVAAGVNRLCVITGWQSDSLRAALAARPATGAIEIETHHNSRWENTGPVDSLRCADAWLRAAPTLVVYGDCCYAPDVIDSVCRHYQDGWLIPGDRLWSALWSLRFEQPLQDAERWRSQNGQLVEIGGRAMSLQRESAQFMGLLAVDPPAWQRCSDSLARRCVGQQQQRDRLDMTALLSHLLDDGETIGCVEIDGGWVELDSEDDHRRISQAMCRAERDGGRWSHDVRR